MSLTAAFRWQARREFDEAANWYEERRPGLGARFVAAVGRDLDQAAKNPGRYAEVTEGVHEGIVQEFPYCVYFREEPKQIVVLAVFHASRDPAVWQSRI